MSLHNGYKMGCLLMSHQEKYKVEESGKVNKVMNHADIVQIDDTCVKGNT